MFVECWDLSKSPLNSTDVIIIGSAVRLLASRVFCYEDDYLYCYQEICYLDMYIGLRLAFRSQMEKSF